MYLGESRVIPKLTFAFGRVKAGAGRLIVGTFATQLALGIVGKIGHFNITVGRDEKPKLAIVAGRVIAHGHAATGLSRRKWTADAARVRAQVSDHQQRFDPVMNRLEALYRGCGIACAGAQVYAPRYREEWLGKIPHAGVRRRAELLYQQLDGLQALRRTLRPELLAESRKHKAVKLLRQDSLNRSDSGRPLAGNHANPAPVSQQAAI